MGVQKCVKSFLYCWYLFYFQWVRCKEKLVFRLIVTQINAKQLYIVTNGFTSYKLDGNTVTFSSKWNGGSMETGVFQVTANPWLSVKSSAPFTIKMLSPREFLISAIDESAVVLPNVDVDVHTAPK